jgi:hypothetical protein
MKIRTLPLLLAITVITIPSASAMGSGDKYQDAQTGLTYKVYKPSDTAGLKATSFKLLDCGSGMEQWIAVKYGTGKKYFEILENMANKPCYDAGLAKKLPSVKINSLTAQAYVFCDPGSMSATKYKKCGIADFNKLGGYLAFTTKGSSNLKGTQILIQGFGGVTYKQLLAIAKGLKPMLSQVGVSSVTQTLPPVMIDPATTSEVTVRITNTIVLTVSDPGNWSATIAEVKVAKFVTGGDQGGYTTNPGISPLAVGSTIATVTSPSGEIFTLAITVTP